MKTILNVIETIWRNEFLFAITIVTAFIFMAVVANLLQF